MRTRRNVLLLCGIVIPLVCVVAFTLNRISLGAQDPPDPKAAIKHQRREARYSAKFYPNSRYPGMFISQQQSGIFNVVHYDYVETKNLEDPAARTALRNEDHAARRKLFCASDLVIRGEVLKAEGKITEDDLFVYSVYTIKVSDVFRTAPDVQVEPGSIIEMTAAGGIVMLDEKRRIDFRNPAMLALKPSFQYILQLKHDSEADDYYPLRGSGLYVFDVDKLKRMDTLMSDHFATRARFSGMPSTLEEFKTEAEQINCN